MAVVVFLHVLGQALELGDADFGRDAGRDELQAAPVDGMEGQGQGWQAVDGLLHGRIAGRGGALPVWCPWR